MGDVIPVSSSEITLSFVSEYSDFSLSESEMLDSELLLMDKMCSARYSSFSFRCQTDSVRILRV